MRIANVTIQNFRAVENTSMAFGGVTTIIGENNAGKSTFLQAIDLFFAASPKIRDRDFHKDRRDIPIAITIEFTELTDSEQTLFQSNLIEDRLIVTRSFYGDGSGESGQFSVDVFANSQFTALREAGKREQLRIYREELTPLYDLPPVKSSEDALEQLARWEYENPDGLARIRVGGFRGAQNVAMGQLKAKTEFILVPAAEEPSEKINDSKSSPILQLLNTITRQTIENNPAFTEFRDVTNEKLREFTSPDHIQALQDISTGLTEILQEFYSTSEMVASWLPPSEVTLDMPLAQVQMMDNGYKSPVEGVGHGLQRAAFLSILRFVANHQASAEEDTQDFETAQSDLILGIEEPELYQHPTKQRIFKEVLNSLAEGFSRATGIRIQIVYATHSPLLVDLARCSDIRLVKRENLGGDTCINVHSTTLDECSQLTAELKGLPPDKAWSGKVYGAKLHVLTPEIAEGFFARCVVLVEGVSDRSLIEAAYKAHNRQPLSEGIFIASVDGKNKMDKPAVIFQSLGVPVYLIFDNDQVNGGAKKSSYNRLLQRIGGAEENPPDWPRGVFDGFTAWSGNIEKYLISIVGQDEYDRAKNLAAEHFDIDSEDACKSPVIASMTLQTLRKGGSEFPELMQIVDRVDAILNAAPADQR